MFINVVIAGGKADCHIKLTNSVVRVEEGEDNWVGRENRAQSYAQSIEARRQR